MSFHEFIFSHASNHRLKRHLAGWAVYGLYYYLQSISPDCVKGLDRSEVFHNAFNSFLCYLPACILCVYSCLYILEPVFLRHKKYLGFFAALLLLFCVTVVVNYFFSVLFFRLSCHCDVRQIIFMRKFAIGFLNSQNAIIIGCLALGCKLTVNFYRQKEENLVLARQKMKTTLGIMKMKIHPGYFFLSLNSIGEHIKANQPDSPEMIVHFSDLLSYWLYEEEEELVPLEYELGIVHKFISLEEAREGSCCTVDVSVTGETASLYIVPMILLPLVQSAYTNAYQKGKMHPLRLVLAADTKQLTFKILFGDGGNWSGLQIADTEMIRNTVDRLNLFYQDKYRLTIDEESGFVCMALMLPVIAQQEAVQRSTLLSPLPASTAYEPV